MTRSELIKEISKAHPTLRKSEVQSIVEAIFDTLTEGICTNGRVEIRGFGAFFVKERPARSAINPRTGEPVQVPKKRMLRFKAGKAVFERLNPN